MIAAFFFRFGCDRCQPLISAATQVLHKWQAKRVVKKLATHGKGEVAARELTNQQVAEPLRVAAIGQLVLACVALQALCGILVEQARAPDKIQCYVS